MTGMIADLKVNAAAMRAGTARGFITPRPTSPTGWCAAWACRSARPSHHITGSIVKLAEDRGCGLEDLSLGDMQAIEGGITDEVFPGPVGRQRRPEPHQFRRHRAVPGHRPGQVGEGALSVNIRLNRVALVMMLALSLAACGKKGAPGAPQGRAQHLPRAPIRRHPANRRRRRTDPRSRIWARARPTPIRRGAPNNAMSESFRYQQGSLHAEAVRSGADRIRGSARRSIAIPVRPSPSAIAGSRRRWHPLGGRICYAVKANSNQAVLTLLAKLGAGADVVSEGEARRAIAAGVAPRPHRGSPASAKTEAELAYALDTGHRPRSISRASADLELLSQLAVARGKRMPIAIRVNPDVRPR